MGILIGIILSGCQALVSFQPGPTADDTRQENYLTSVQERIRKNDFAVAEKESRRILEIYRCRPGRDSPDRNAPVRTNYARQAQIMILLLNRIIDDETKMEALDAESLKNRERAAGQTRMILSLKKKLSILKKEVENTKARADRVRSLEKENMDLLKQIDRLKAIDLNPT